MNEGKSTTAEMEKQYQLSIIMFRDRKETSFWAL